MLIKTKAIVLHAFKYGESRLIAELLTADRGRVSCVMPVPKSPRAKLKRQYLQPLFVLEVVLDARQRPGLMPLKEARVAYPFASIPFNPYKLSISLFLSEFLRLVTRGAQIDEIAFEYIVNSVLWLDGCTEGFANFHLVFMMRLSRFLGFYPNIDDYEPGSWFDMRLGSFCPQPPLHSDRLAPSDAAKMGLLLRMNYPTMHLFRMSREERGLLADAIVSYYRVHVPDFPELKSLPVLKELFSDGR